MQQSFANNIKNIEYEMVGEECTQEEVMIGDLTITQTTSITQYITKFLLA